MIYYVESNLLVTGEYALNKSNDSQFKEAVLGTFSANKMHIEPISDPSIDSMNYFAQYKTSEAVFAGFSKNGLDSNPLDIRQKRHIAFDEPRATNEEKKRIVPMDLEKIEKRFDNVGEDFTWKTLTGHKKVQIDVSVYNVHPFFFLKFNTYYITHKVTPTLKFWPHNPSDRLCK